jgi:hypothetical protein
MIGNKQGLEAEAKKHILGLGKFPFTKAIQIRSTTTAWKIAEPLCYLFFVQTH